MNQSQGQSASIEQEARSQAFLEIYNAHSARVMSFALRSGFSRADAEDLTQETFLLATQSFGTFDPRKGTLAQWLGGIARNLFRKHWAKVADERNYDPAIGQEVLFCDDSPLQDAADGEELAALRECIASLPVEHSEIIRLRYVDAMTTRGMAALTGMAESTVRLRLTEAWELLEKCMKSKGFLREA